MCQPAGSLVPPPPPIFIFVLCCCTFSAHPDDDSLSPYSGSCSHTGVTSSTINVCWNALTPEEQAGTYTTYLIIQTFVTAVTCLYGTFVCRGRTDELKPRNLFPHDAVCSSLHTNRFFCCRLTTSRPRSLCQQSTVIHRVVCCCGFTHMVGNKTQ